MSAVGIGLFEALAPSLRVRRHPRVLGRREARRALADYERASERERATGAARRARLSLEPAAARGAGLEMDCPEVTPLDRLVAGVAAAARVWAWARLLEPLSDEERDAESRDAENRAGARFARRARIGSAGDSSRAP